jgi:predicted DNA binding CopG/RHH family protein
MPEFKRLNMRLPMDLYELIKTESEKSGMPVSAVINFAVKEYLKQNSILNLAKMYEEERQRELSK